MVSNSNPPTSADAPQTEAERQRAAKTPYLQAVGSLLWAQGMSHMEITYPVKIASMRSHDHGAAAWSWVKNIVGYLRVNPYPRHILRHAENPRIRVWTDSNHNKHPDDRRPLSGWITPIYIDCDHAYDLAPYGSESWPFGPPLGLVELTS